MQSGDFRCYATLTVEVDANWKTIADGFSETYHIQTLHPELLRCVDDIHAPQQIWGHTGKSDQPYGVQSPRFEGALSDEEVWDAYVYTQGALMGAAEGTPFPADERQPGQTVQDLIAARTQGICGRARGRSRLGRHRPDHPAAPVQRVPEHDAAGQRRPPDRHVLAPRPGPR